MDIDPYCNDYENAMCSLELAKKYGLQVEVFCTAIAYIRADSKLSISKAFKAAQYDWDICVPLPKEEKESPEEIEEFNNHMRTLAKAKELGELASNPEGVKEMSWPEDFDSKH
jgi:hypothetical protein